MQKLGIKISELESLKNELNAKLIKQRDEDSVIGIEEAVTAGQIALVDRLIVAAKKRDK
ncbi:hypothetical protein [Bacillus thuringiensis]|uniref:hypothetical protein n=1 Tax=Bacillus thuringiensis TaxID=1428 RepID=UPI000D5786DB|nr:hypothetical protein [Bacillus thuringiensis]MBD8076487.1 hypothetical protein [Bacillus thuringiensis]